MCFRFLLLLADQVKAESVIEKAPVLGVFFETDDYIDHDFTHNKSLACLPANCHNPNTLTATRPPPIQRLKSKSLRMM